MAFISAKTEAVLRYQRIFQKRQYHINKLRGAEGFISSWLLVALCLQIVSNNLFVTQISDFSHYAAVKILSFNIFHLSMLWFIVPFLVTRSTIRENNLSDSIPLNFPISSNERFIIHLFRLFKNPSLPVLSVLSVLLLFPFLYFTAPAAGIFTGIIYFVFCFFSSILFFSLVEYLTLITNLFIDLHLIFLLLLVILLFSNPHFTIENRVTSINIFDMTFPFITDLGEFAGSLWYLTSFIPLIFTDSPGWITGILVSLSMILLSGIFLFLTYLLYKAQNTIESRQSKFVLVTVFHDKSCFKKKRLNHFMYNFGLFIKTAEIKASFLITAAAVLYINLTNDSSVNVLYIFMISFMLNAAPLANNCFGFETEAFGRIKLWPKSAFQFIIQKNIVFLILFTVPGCIYTFIIAIMTDFYTPAAGLLMISGISFLYLAFGNIFSILKPEKREINRFAGLSQTGGITGILFAIFSWYPLFKLLIDISPQNYDGILTFTAVFAITSLIAYLISLKVSIELFQKNGLRS